MTRALFSDTFNLNTGWRLKRESSCSQSTAGLPDGGDKGTSGEVRAEEIRTLYRQSPWVMALNPINAAVVGAVIWSRERAPIVVGWVITAALVTVLRALLRARYLRTSPPVEQARVWGRRYVGMVAASGLVWGVGSVLLFAPGSHGTELILVFVIGGMTAGASGTLAYHLAAFLAFTVPTLLPLVVRLLVEGDGLHLAMGMLGLLYGAALAMIAVNTHRAIAESFRLRFENQDLLAGLSRAQLALQEVNRTLEQRVVERGLALEQQADALRDARRMESLGRLAGGIAHDFNNLLTVVLGNVSTLISGTDLGEGMRQPLEEVREAAGRAAALVTQLLAFSRRQPRRPRVVDLNAVVSATQRLLSRLIGEHVELVFELYAGPLPIYADPAQLEQVLINLSTNARDAMSRGGRLTIETELVHIAPGESPLAPTFAPGAYGVLRVRDTGVGMDAETRRMIFDPFFTTKAVGQGTGLGLATVHGIVEQSGGHVLVESEPGSGSSFRVFLPRAEGSITAEAAPDTLPPSTGRQATVLVVEDEQLVRSVIVRTLERRGGFTVLQAADGEEALELADRCQGTIHLVVTDVVMARMGGPELIERLIEIRPGICVLFISGYSRNAVLPAANVGRGVDFLQKPFTASELVDRVTHLLAHAASEKDRPATPPSSGSRRAPA